MNQHRAVNSYILIFFLFFSVVAPLYTQNRYPHIDSLSHSNVIFKQLSDDVKQARIAIASIINEKTATIPFSVYSYTAIKNDTLITIAARAGIPYDSLATLNRIASIKESIEGKTILIPSMPGLYLYENTTSSFEKLLAASNEVQDSFFFEITVNLPKKTTKEKVRCIPEKTFDGTVRAFFLTPSFRFPLPEGIITSVFGMRKNPVTGNPVFHKGIDLAAPEGTPVLACASGKVIYTGYNPIHGNFILIDHENAKTSLYGHLSSIKIKLHDIVKSGSIIGAVGSTGQSTGPHLHFEIHENGVPKDPSGFLKGN